MKSNIGIVKFGGIAFILSGILFLGVSLFLLPVPNPPLSDTELMNWLEEWKFNISMADELLIFAALMLIPSIAGLYRILVKVDKLKALLGCGLLAVTVPVYIILDSILGRLVYPVYDIELSPDIYRLVLSIYYGGMHTVAIILCIATILLSLVIRKSVLGKPVAIVGFVTALLDLIGAFPWLTGSIVFFVCQVASVLWFVFVGVRMISKNNPGG
ncbi:hypothetical protein PAECIP111892_01372 [Paenibacillus auburnensis]|uniref:DUF4386 family protein n=1 Tax=Paenibacillus auburnensis TaxID=2905649 RepID=A0ABM9BST3_9BACL|nr:hypothetical protein [Paenibacillus auburnensis]CAH1193984.1 hypothetical protein PAECIP111892_01372 [Paenibacillus auburnensis]